MPGDLVKIGQLASKPRAQRVWLSGGDQNPDRPAVVTDQWRVSALSDLTLNDNDKTFTVPANTEYQILWIWVEFTSDGNAGDRQLEIEVQNSGADVVANWARAGIVQITGLTRNYLFAPAVADLTIFRDTDYLSNPIPGTPFLKAGDILRVFDNNNVAAGDDMIVHIQIASRTV